MSDPVHPHPVLVYDGPAAGRTLYTHLHDFDFFQDDGNRTSYRVARLNTRVAALYRGQPIYVATIREQPLAHFDLTQWTTPEQIATYCRLLDKGNDHPCQK